MQEKKVKNLIARAKILQETRNWFIKNQFIEVETPILVDSPDLSFNLNILTTAVHPDQDIGHSELSAMDSPAVETQNFASLGNSISQENKSIISSGAQKKALITSPEFSMKKLLAENGLDNIFTITKVFRDGEGDTGIHNIEFTMLEWYRKNSDYTEIMRDTENLIFTLAKKFQKRDYLVFNGHKCDIRLPWQRLKLTNLFKKFSKIKNVEKISLAQFRKIILDRQYSKEKNLTYEQCFHLIFLNEIEPFLPKNKAFFLMDYPKPLACLAKLKKGNPYIAERFEAYVAGIELCNAFSELTKGKSQLKRFHEEIKERKKFHKQIFPVDTELCRKLDLIGHAGGNALGLDRLIMLLLNEKSIDDIISFPVKY